MSIKTLLTAAVLVVGTASATFAQTAVPEYDGDGNRIPGQSVVLPQASAALERSFAGPRGAMIESSYGANGAAWQRQFDARLSRAD